MATVFYDIPIGEAYEEGKRFAEFVRSEHSQDRRGHSGPNSARFEFYDIKDTAVITHSSYSKGITRLAMIGVKERISLLKSELERESRTNLVERER